MTSPHRTSIGPRFHATNEPVLSYGPGSAERMALQRELEEQVSNQIDIPLVIGSQRVISPAQVAVTAPHDHARQLGKLSQATANQARQAIEAAVKAQADWSRWSRSASGPRYARRS